MNVRKSPMSDFFSLNCLISTSERKTPFFRIMKQNQGMMQTCKINIGLHDRYCKCLHLRFMKKVKKDTSETI